MKLRFKEFLIKREQYASAPITAAPDNTMHPGASNNPPTPVMAHPLKTLGVFATKPHSGKVFNLQTKGANKCFNLDGQAGACIPLKKWAANPFQNGDIVSIDYFANPRTAQTGKPTRDIASVSIVKRSSGG